MFRYWFLTIYVVVSFLKSMRHLYDHELTDPRISYTKRMHLIHEHVKKGFPGDVLINQDQS
ncbi:hypothetical protein BsIDN1_37870 [Bacillus safensis]|uniref:Uncharacterized protein n=1 Tax=Bacillus safensis TaxID=561879 RepID=A0A5S9MDZ7_BACIA|nr:hypothetical protein BsIDN1_37870 [Bacillus safensis]